MFNYTNYMQFQRARFINAYTGKIQKTLASLQAKQQHAANKAKLDSLKVGR